MRSNRRSVTRRRKATSSSTWVSNANSLRAARSQFAFDTHVDELVAFLRRVTDRRFDRVGTAPVA